ITELDLRSSPTRPHAKTAIPAVSPLPSQTAIRELGRHGSSARASQLHLWRLWDGEHSEARRCHPVPRVRLPYPLQEAHPPNCSVRGTLENDSLADDCVYLSCL
ncbi:unnamed protein product, partial [Linum tenue]